MSVGENAAIDETVVLGTQSGGEPPKIGDDVTLRSGTIIYSGVEVGDRFTTGHNVLVREDTKAGDDVLVGTNAVVDGSVSIGSRVSIQSCAYVPPESRLGNDVFLGPCAVLTNDPYPVRANADLDGPTLENHVSVGANATVLPGMTIGERAFVAAGSVVTRDVPAETLAVGVPAEHRPLPRSLRNGNTIR